MTELVPTPHPLTIYQDAVKQGLSPDTLREIFELAKDYEQHEAAKKYAEAIAGFQSECPTVFKGRSVPTKTGGTKFTFAGYDDIKRVTRQLERKYGIVTGFDFKFADAMLHGTIRVRVGNYFEDKSSAIAVPKGYDCNDAQNMGQAMTYLKRYLYVAALDIVITDEDNDAAGLYQKVTPDQIEDINILIEKCEKAGNPVDFTRFLAWLEIESLDELPAAKFADVVSDLNRKMKGGRK